MLYRGQRDNGGFIYIALKPLNERKVGAAEIINRLRPKLNRLPVASAFLQAAQDLRIGGRSARRSISTRSSRTTCGSVHWGPILLAQMKKLPGFQDVNTDQQNGGLERISDVRPHHGGAAWDYGAVAGLCAIQRRLGSLKFRSSIRN